MDNIRFENAFTGVPPTVHARVLNALQEVKTVRKAKPIAALVLAAILTLTLTGAAVAVVQSGVLDYLFRDVQPTEEQRDMVQPVGTTHASDGITTTLTDLVFDGREMSFALRFELTRNAFVVVDHVTICGVNAYETNSNVSDMWLCAPLAAVESPQSRGVTVSIDAACFDKAEHAALEDVYQRMKRDGKADVSVGLTLLAPKGGLAPVDAYSADTAAMWTRIDAILAAGDTPISEAEPYEVLTGSAALGSEFHKGLPAQHPLGDADAYVEFANMTALDAFTMDFTITASDAADAALQAAYQRSPVSDGRVRVAFDEVRFTPFATDIRLRITPEEGQMTNAEIAAIYKWFAFYDEKHTLIESAQSSGAGLEEQADGTLVYRVELHLGALENPPEVLHLVPCNEDSSAEHPLWAYDIPIVCSSENTEE